MKGEISFDVRLVNYTREYLDLSWEWFRDPEFRRQTLTPDFSKEDQESWFSQLDLKYNYMIWGVEVNDNPAGACGIKNISEARGEYWGYIGVKELRGKGIGNQMMAFVEERAVGLNLKALCLKVLDSNLSAINLYTRRDFLETGREGNLVFMEKALLVC